MNISIEQFHWPVDDLQKSREERRRMEIGVGVRGTDSCIFIGVEAYAQYGFVCAVTRASFAGFSR